MHKLHNYINLILSHSEYIAFRHDLLYFVETYHLNIVDNYLEPDLLLLDILFPLYLIKFEKLVSLY